jgi:starch-binding outer membrane protein, SusD/RagB family
MGGGGLVAVLLFSLTACTDLSETPVSAITPDNFYQNEQEVLAGLASVYAELRGTLWAYYNISQVSSDETIVPTRGDDWFDEGRWLQLHYHTWGATTSAGRVDAGDAWVNLNTGVARANVVLSALENVVVPNQARVEAELRTLRAFFYYLLMDLFGGVPIVATREDGTTDVAIEPRARNTRAEVFNFIESELNAARPALPSASDLPLSQHGRLTQGAVDAILASMYLNAGVFTRDTGVDPTGHNSCADVQIGGGNACEAAIAAVDRILDSGAYSLAADWRSNFTPDNLNSPENILVVKHLNDDGLGMNFLHRALHYHQLSPSPWNGFSTLAETYYAFDLDNDKRAEIFLVGCQFDFVTGDPLTDRGGAPLCFTPEIGNERDAREHEGVRVAKWPPDPNSFGEHNANDFPYFRLAEMYLIKAEALNEIGQTAAATDLVNVIRERAFDPPQPLSGLNQATFRDAILDERLFELTTEAKRRKDLIRHGQFTAAWFAKDVSNPRVLLMPIPQGHLDTNPLLTQNPGY